MTGVERRQVFELPEVVVTVTEHLLIERECGCGHPDWTKPDGTGPSKTVQVSYRGAFACIADILPSGEPIQLCRLRYGSSAHLRFAIYSAARGGYQDSFLRTGSPTGTPRKPSTPPAPSTSPGPAATPPLDPWQIYGLTTESPTW